MKTLLTTIICFITTVTFGQGIYEKNMGEALSKWKNGQTTEALAQLQRIASVEKTNWIPRYYQAFILTTSTFTIKDAQQKEEFQHAATQILEDSTQSKNSEYWVLKGLLATAELTSDPMNKGKELSPIIIKDYQTALAIDPQNPRAILCLNEFKINSKRFFGQDYKNELEELKKALPLFQNNKTNIAFYPNWGKEKVEKLIADAK